MRNDNGVRWVWEDTEYGGIPASIEAFWEAARRQHYTGDVADGDLCTAYRKDEENGAVVEDLFFGRYDAGEDVVEAMLHVSYGHFDTAVVTAEVPAFTYDVADNREDGYRIAPFDPRNVLRDGHEKSLIDIHDVPQPVMEQLREHGTYYHKNGPDVLSMDRWDDRLIRFHGTDRE